MRYNCVYILCLGIVCSAASTRSEVAYLDMSRAYLDPDYQTICQQRAGRASNVKLVECLGLVDVQHWQQHLVVWVVGQPLYGDRTVTMADWACLPSGRKHVYWLLTWL